MAFPTDQQRKVALTIQASRVPGNLTDYVALITRDCLPDEMCSPTDGNAAQSDGGDIRFSSDSAGSTQLAAYVHRFEHDTSDGAGDADVQIWVKVPSISGSVDTDIYCWYSTTGTTAAPSAGDTYGRNAVFSDMTVFYAMDEDPSASAPQITDLTGNGHDMTSAGGMVGGDVVSAQVGEGLEFNGSSQRLTASDHADLDLTTLTIRGWLKTDGSITTPDETVLIKGTLSATEQNYWVCVQNNKLQARHRVGGTTYFEPSTASVDDGSFHYFAVTYNNDSWQIFVDSNSPDGGTFAAGIATTNGDLAVAMQANNGSYQKPFGGVIDCVAIWPVVLSSDYVGAEYNNQNDPATFIVAGTPEAGGGVGGSVGAAAYYYAQM